MILVGQPYVVALGAVPFRLNIRRVSSFGFWQDFAMTPAEA